MSRARKIIRLIFKIRLLSRQRKNRRRQPRRPLPKQNPSETTTADSTAAQAATDTSPKASIPNRPSRHPSRPKRKRQLLKRQKIPWIPPPACRFSHRLTPYTTHRIADRRSLQPFNRRKPQSRHSHRPVFEVNKSDVAGAAGAPGATSAATKATELGRYKAKVYRAVGGRRLVRQRLGKVSFQGFFPWASSASNLRSTPMAP